MRLLILLLIPVLNACSTLMATQAWQKADLARPDMQATGDPLSEAFTAHIYFSKEAASGGRGFAGGGCGCN